ncbi:MAG: hypothetical protein ACR2N4_09205 [Jatrophihabitans sp.]
MLPKDGRGPNAHPPEWPLTPMSVREAELWASHWMKPQSVIWERDQVFEYVAMYVRQLSEAEAPKSSAENRKTVRLMAADLFLTSDSMARAKYRIETSEVEVEEYAEPQPEPAPTGPSSKDRFLRAVPDAGGG